MDNKNPVINNLRIGKLITASTNVLTAIIFFFVYLNMKNVIFLIVTIILLLTAVFILIYYRRVEIKYIEKMDNLNIIDKEK
jgi:hypothetical protein